MTVTLLLGSPHERSVLLHQSPLAELCACLHALDEPGHHPGSARWVATAHSEVDDTLLARAVTWAPLWSAFRARYLLPVSAATKATLDAELAGIEALPPADFVAMTVQALIGKNDTALAGPDLSDGVMHRLWLISSSRLELGLRLREDPGGFRRRLLDFLADFSAAAFEREWPQVKPLLEHDAALRRRALRRRGPLVLGDFPTATTHDDPPRVTLDKLYNATARIDEHRPCILIPTVHGRPHFVVKHFPGYPVVIQHGIEHGIQQGVEHGAADDPVPSLETVRRRLAALQDPTRLKLCYAILRNPVATAELATQLGMTAPQVSRHLRRLREAGLVHFHRRGPVVYYQLDAEAIGRLGPDLLSVLYR
ncbi:DUF5937 family protein [Streptosporangium soli]|nr:DUF5937 family protein [Streptosporangium sp. KLBMP 9127]